MFNKYKEYKKVVLISIIIIIATSLALYFSPTRKSNNSSQKGIKQSTVTEEQKKKQSTVTEEQKKKQEAQKVNPDVSKTESLKKEKQVINGQVYVQNNVATATMIIKDDVSEADAKALADEYAKQLKEQYKGMKVNVQAVQKGKRVADITIEK